MRRAAVDHETITLVLFLLAVLSKVFVVSLKRACKAMALLGHKKQIGQSTQDMAA